MDCVAGEQTDQSEPTEQQRDLSAAGREWGKSTEGRQVCARHSHPQEYVPKHCPRQTQLWVRPSAGCQQESEFILLSKEEKHIFYSKVFCWKDLSLFVEKFSWSKIVFKFY